MSIQFSTPLQLGDRRHDPTEGLARLYATWAAGGVGVSVTGIVSDAGPASATAR